MTNLNSNFSPVGTPVEEPSPPHFDLLAGLWRAPTFSRAFYQDVGLQWRGIGLRYLMLLLFLSWLIVATHWTVQLSAFIRDDAAAMFAKFPAVTIKGGHASSPVAQPYILKDNGGKPIFVLDTTGATKFPSDVGAQYLLTADDWIQEQGGRREVHSLKTAPDMTVDSGTLLHWTTIGRNLILPVVFPLFWVFSLAYRIVAALILAAIGLLIAKMFRTPLSYAALLRLSMVSMTTGVILGTAASFIPVYLGCSAWFIGVAVAIGYLVFGIRSCSLIARNPGLAFPVELTAMPPQEFDTPQMLP